MEKRFVLFLVFSMAVMFGYLALVQSIAPKQAKKQMVGAKEKGKGSPVEPKPGDLAARTGPNQPAEKPLGEPAKIESAKTESAKAPDVASPPTPSRWVSLGSYAANEQNALLVTFTNRGAAVERIELTERVKTGELRYRNLEERGAYLGQLALTPVSPSGLRVNVVGAGTPAALARPIGPGWETGLRVEDVLVKADDQFIDTVQDLDRFLDTKKPGAMIRVTVDRKTGEETKRGEFSVRLDTRPFELLRPERLEPGEFRPHPPSLLMSLTHLGESAAELGENEISGLTSLRNNTWEVTLLDGPPAGVEFRLRLDAAQLQPLGAKGDVEIVKRYRLGAAGDLSTKPGGPLPHHLKLEIELINHGAQPLPMAYRLDGPNGLTLEGWWYLAKTHPKMFYSAGARDIVYRTVGEGHRLIGCPEIFKYFQKNPTAPERLLFAEGDKPDMRSLLYAGVDTQYFLSALVPQGNSAEKSEVFRRAAATTLSDIAIKAKEGRSQTTNVSFQVTTPVHEVRPGTAHRREFLLFAGAKEPRLLEAYGLGDSLYYGWFGWVARPLSGILHFFYLLVRNYGVAIVMLTVLVRGCMFPVSLKAAKNAAMMQALAPEMRQIAEKYKNDMEKRAKAQQELFRKHNYNPFSGCWLAFLQLPVFIGLYRALAVDIELRQAPLIPGISWCSNLAGPDELYYWKWMLFPFLGSETGMLGPYLNVLPFFTIALFLINQKMFTPPATDEQTRMQMQMMQFMTVFIGIMFFKVASGLCVYFIASSLWSIAERKLLGKGPIKNPEKPPVLGKPTERRSWLSRIGADGSRVQKRTPRPKLKRR